MVIFRFVALVLIVAALMVLGYDALTSLSQGGEVHMISLDSLWTMVHQGSLDSFKGWVASTGGESVAGGVDTVLAWPAFAVIGVLGVVLAFIFRPRED